MKTKHNDILRVQRTRAQVKASYNKLSRMYDYIAGIFEKQSTHSALKQLHIQNGETVLEIGCGTGQSLRYIVGTVGEHGNVYGIDISSGMLAVSRQRLAHAGFLKRVNLSCGDAVTLPYRAQSFDVVFMSFVLELFDTPEISQVLGEIRRVLKHHGKLGVLSLSKEGGNSMLLRLYEWLHQKLPQYLDCRPIYVEHVLRDAGFEIISQEHVELWGLEGEIVIGITLS